MSRHCVVVTGASGYLGSWIVREFLAEGWRVLGSVREKHNSEKVAHLHELTRRLPGSLELFEADLLREHSFDDACARASVVVHAASPFLLGEVEDPVGQLVEPAVQGTRNILSSATRSGSVKRVVLTSGLVALHGDAVEVGRSEKGYLDEGAWNSTSSLSYQPYNFAKSEAERASWELAKGAPWHLVVLNPGLILGPSLSSRSDAASTRLFLRLLGGEFAFGAPALAFGVVDVRDVARAHYEAAVREEAEGRNILVATHATLLEIAQTVDRLYPGVHPVPNRELPKLLLYLLGPRSGLSWRYIRRNAGHPVRYDNRKGKVTLGLFYRPLEETIRDQRLQLLDDGLL
ncbi:MAG: NAD-dependent epimerase/dehydratase family protein [Spirochaetaceae bacterium]